MPVPTSNISMVDLNNEFGLGYSLGNYQNTVYYVNGSGFQAGTSNISIGTFAGATATPPLPANVVLYAPFFGDGVTSFGTSARVYTNNGSGTQIYDSSFNVTGSGSNINNSQGSAISGESLAAYANNGSNSNGWVLGNSPNTDVLNVLSTSSSFSVEFWVYLYPRSATFGRLFSWGGYFDGGSGIEIENYGNDVRYRIGVYDGTGDRTTYTFPNMNLYNWNHVYYATDFLGHHYVGINGTLYAFYYGDMNTLSPFNNLALGRDAAGTSGPSQESAYQQLIVRNNIPYTNSFTPSNTPLI